jgi:activator of HSP90 ATPase
MHSFLQFETSINSVPNLVDDMTKVNMYSSFCDELESSFLFREDLVQEMSMSYSDTAHEMCVNEFKEFQTLT